MVTPSHERGANADRDARRDVSARRGSDPQARCDEEEGEIRRAVVRQSQESRRVVGGRSGRLGESDLGGEVGSTFEGSRLRLRGGLGRSVRSAFARIAGPAQGSLSRRGDQNPNRRGLRPISADRTAATRMIRGRRSDAARPGGDRTFLSPSRRFANHRQHAHDRHEGDQGEPKMGSKHSHVRRNSKGNDDKNHFCHSRIIADPVKPDSRSVGDPGLFWVSLLIVELVGEEGEGCHVVGTPTREVRSGPEGTGWGTNHVAPESP